MKRSIIGILITLTIAILLAICGSDGGVNLKGVPLFSVCGLVAFSIHWLVFIPSFIYRTEHYFDLTGSITYLSVVACALLGNPENDSRNLLIGMLIIIWAIRLGSFLYRRVRQVGKDDRFDDLKHNFLAFFMVWTLSGLWVFLTAAAALAAITSTDSKPWGLVGYVGVGVWLIGFSIEVLADTQKSRFRKDPSNAGRFISEGIWSWSRHPNYFGEIVLWSGIAVIAYPALSGWQYVTLISPIFVFFLLVRVSGIPMLEAKADEKWGKDAAYKAYRNNTSILALRPPKRHSDNQ